MYFFFDPVCPTNAERPVVAVFGGAPAVRRQYLAVMTAQHAGHPGVAALYGDLARQAEEAAVVHEARELMIQAGVPADEAQGLAARLVATE